MIPADTMLSFSSNLYKSIVRPINKNAETIYDTNNAFSIHISFACRYTCLSMSSLLVPHIYARKGTKMILSTYCSICFPRNAAAHMTSFWSPSPSCFFPPFDRSTAAPTTSPSQTIGEIAIPV